MVTDKSSSMYQCKSSKYSLKPSGDRKELKESQFEQSARSQPPHIRDVMDDAIKSVEGSRVNVNRPVARERHNISEHSSSLVKEDHNSAITIVTSLPWPYRQMYSCIRQKGGRTSSKSPRR